MLRNERLVVLWSLVIAGLAGDFFLPLYFDYLGMNDEATAMLATLLVGCVCAQVGILSAWCVMANVAAMIRVPVCLAVLALGTCLMLAGMHVVDDTMDIDGVIVISTMAIMVIAGTQIPLWIILVTTRRRIGLKTETALEHGSRKFSIRYLMLATAAIAMLIALIQAVVPEGSPFFSLAAWLGFAGVMALFSLFSASLTIPGLWLVLSDDQSARTSAAVGMFIAWGGGPILIAMVLAAVGFQGGNGEELKFFYAFGTGACGAMIGVLFILRGLGYRLLYHTIDGRLSAASDWPAPPSMRSINVPVDDGTDSN